MGATEVSGENATAELNPQTRVPETHYIFYDEKPHNIFPIYGLSRIATEEPVKSQSESFDEITWFSGPETSLLEMQEIFIELKIDDSDWVMVGHDECL